MKRINFKQLKQHLVLIGILPITLITFLFDYLHVRDLGYFNSLEYLHEGLVSFNVILIYFYLRSFRIFSERRVKKNLFYIVVNLVAVYVIVFLLKLLLNPVFIITDFPPDANNFNTILYANLVSLVGSFSMVAFILSIRNLILFKYKKRTRIYFIITLVLISLTAIITVALKIPLDLSFNGKSAYNNTLFSLALIFIFLLSTRNSWITYLTRKEKYYYLFASFAMVWGVSYLFDYAYDLPVAYHSLALGVFINASWFFLLFYSLLSMLNFLLQLPTARVFERKMREVASLQNLSRAISGELDRNKLSRLITDLILEVTASNYAWIELFDPNKNALFVAATKNLSARDMQKLNHGILGEFNQKIIQEKRPLVINDLHKEFGKNYFFGLKAAVSSLVGIPIIGVNHQFFGILYAAKSETFGFDPDDVNLLEAFANQVAIALENAELLQKSFERERLERELQIAREVQLRLLPQRKPQLPSYALESVMITAYEVGGDYYDFIERENGNLELVIGDVSGKGTSAAFYMAETKGVIQSMAQHYLSPSEILSYANRVLSDSMEKKSFITLLVAHLNSKTHQMRFARAGHCPVLHYNAVERKIHLLQPPGIAVGLDRGEIFNRLLEEYHLDIHPGDVLLFYTDGLTEAMNKKKEEYGEERLSKILLKYHAETPETISKRIIDDVFAFAGKGSLHDDLTLIVLKRHEKDEAPKKESLKNKQSDKTEALNERISS